MIGFLLGLAEYVMVVLVAGAIFFVAGVPIIHKLIEVLFDWVSYNLLNGVINLNVIFYSSSHFKWAAIFRLHSFPVARRRLIFWNNRTFSRYRFWKCIFNSQDRGQIAPRSFLHFLRHAIMHIAKIAHCSPHEFGGLVENMAKRRENDCVLYIFAALIVKTRTTFPEIKTSV